MSEGNDAISEVVSRFASERCLGQDPGSPYDRSLEWRRIRDSPARCHCGRSV